jgi:periplasmic copper chaperone A
MPAPLRRSALRTSVVTAVVAGVAVLGAAPASAHVTAQAPDAVQGGYSIVTLNVPNESATAGTVKLDVKVPTQYAVTTARTEPVPGWTATVTRAPLDPPAQVGGKTVTEAVSGITWTADPGTRIGPDQYQRFAISLGPLPAADRLVLPATQTYDDGEVVAWDEPPADGAEPQQPAPVVALAPAPAGAAADGDGDGDEHAAHTAGSEAADGTAPMATAGDTDDTARWLGGGGLLLGALGAGLGVGTAVRSRRSAGAR